MRAARITRLAALALLALMGSGARAASQDFSCATLPGPAASAGSTWTSSSHRTPVVLSWRGMKLAISRQYAEAAGQYLLVRKLK